MNIVQFINNTSCFPFRLIPFLTLSPSLPMTTISFHVNFLSSSALKPYGEHKFLFQYYFTALYFFSIEYFDSRLFIQNALQTIKYEF